MFPKEIEFKNELFSQIGALTKLKKHKRNQIKKGIRKEKKRKKGKGRKEKEEREKDILHHHHHHHYHHNHIHQITVH